MSGKIISFSPKIEIINHFDELINRVDIEFDECLEKFNEQRILGEILGEILGDLECFHSWKRNVKFENSFDEIILDYNCYCYVKQTVELWSESTKVVDYLEKIRMRTIEELRKEQEDTLEFYKLNSFQFKSSEEITDENKIQELRSKLFGEKFYFQVRYTREKKPWVFNLFTFVTDFYMSQSDINFLELIINNYVKDIKSQILKFNRILDEKKVLISLLYRHFLSNLQYEKFPYPVIFVSKQDILNISCLNIPYIRFLRGIKLTCSSIDLSGLECLFTYYHSEEPNVEDFLDEVDLDGLSSITDLNVYIKSPEKFSARNLQSLEELTLHFGGLMDESNSTRIFEQLSNIKLLRMKGCFSNLNLDSLVNLQKLSLYGEISNHFNFGLLKNLSNHLQELSSYLKFDNDQISKLFDGHNFPCFITLNLKSSKITKLEKKLFQGFPALQNLNIVYNEELRSIEYDSFSSLTNLVDLHLKGNCIDKLDNRTFSALIHLETLNLRKNQIESLDENIFSNLKNLRELNLSYNLLSTLNPQSFFGLRNLENLELSHNILTYFDLRILDNLGKIDRISLYSNSISNEDEIQKRFKDCKFFFTVPEMAKNPHEFV